MHEESGGLKFPAPQDDHDTVKLNSALQADLLEKHPQLKDILTNNADDSVSINVMAVYNYLREAQINISNFRNFRSTRWDNNPRQILEGDLPLIESRIMALKRQMQSESADRKGAIEKFITDYESQFENLRAEVMEFLE